MNNNFFVKFFMFGFLLIIAVFAPVITNYAASDASKIVKNNFKLSAAVEVKGGSLSARQFEFALWYSDFLSSMPICATLNDENGYVVFNNFNPADLPNGQHRFTIRQTSYNDADWTMDYSDREVLIVVQNHSVIEVYYGGVLFNPALNNVPIFVNYK